MCNEVTQSTEHPHRAIEGFGDRSVWPGQTQSQKRLAAALYDRLQGEEETIFSHSKRQEGEKRGTEAAWN